LKAVNAATREGRIPKQSREEWRFSNSCGLAGVVEIGFFLKKKPAESGGFGLRQLEKRATAASNRELAKEGRLVPFEPV
jgi:hypothetical protein